MARLGSCLSLVFVALFVVEFTWALPRFGTREESVPTKNLDPKTLALVEKQLLALFGLKKRVPPREHFHVPEFMKETFKKWNGEAHDDTDPMTNIIRALHHDGKCIFVTIATNLCVQKVQNMSPGLTN